MTATRFNSFARWWIWTRLAAWRHDRPRTPRCCWRKTARRRATSLESLEHAIAEIEREVRRVQANISEQRKRLEVYRDVAVMGLAERG